MLLCEDRQAFLTNVLIYNALRDHEPVKGTFSLEGI